MHCLLSSACAYGMSDTRHVVFQSWKLKRCWTTGNSQCKPMYMTLVANLYVENTEDRGEGEYAGSLRISRLAPTTREHS